MLRDQLRSILALRAYFRGAEYPLGRLEAWVEAYRMVRGGWPQLLSGPAARRGVRASLEKRRAR